MRKHLGRVPPQDLCLRMIDQANRMKWLFALRACYNNIFEYHPQLYASLSVCRVVAPKHRLVVRDLNTKQIELVHRAQQQGRGVLIYSCHGGQSATVRALQLEGIKCRLVTRNADYKPVVLASDLATSLEDITCKTIAPDKYTLFRIQRALGKNEVVIVTPDISLPVGYMAASRRLLISPRGFGAISALEAPVLYSVGETGWDWMCRITFLAPGEVIRDDLFAWAHDFQTKISVAQTRPVYREVTNRRNYGPVRPNRWGDKFVFRDASNWHLILPLRFQKLMS
ncbi:MAG: hypothetical protein AAFR98_08180 [Pseudomonadota bacterium]